ncbi:MAG: molybdopterin-dependent oxidoreductase [Gammaproteobacteria bacterium]|nr:molybdopterin-dependent oxidoreductase [Gammaproteobacteria bacterium]
MPSKEVFSVCPHDCPDTCGAITRVEDGRAVAFVGNPSHPITRGWLCAKVNDYLAHACHPDRLRHPLRRTGPKGGAANWRRMSWDEAVGEIADRWRSIIQTYGAEAILPYSYSGTLGLVQLDVCNTRFWNRLGASRLIRAICGSACEFAVGATLGGRRSVPYHHVVDSRLIIVWGANPVSTGPHMMPFIRQAQRRGCELVVIDPRRSRTARGADLHLAPRPGTDAALALGMARAIVDNGLHDSAWLEANTVGWPELEARLADYPLDRVEEITGIEAVVIEDLARRYGQNKPGLIKFADGINRNRNGGQTVRAICALPAITGQYGMRGGGIAYSTSDYFHWDHATLHRRESCPAPGRKVNMNRLGAALTGEAEDPPIMSLYVFAANPVASSPNASLIVEGLMREDLFTVVHEQFLTDTADYADIVLPATSQLEHTDLHRGYGHTFLSYNAAAVPPLEECKSNWETLGLLARAMGFEDPALHRTPDEIIQEMLEATRAAAPELEGITLERLKREGTVAFSLEDEVPFADLRFATPSGKVELYSAPLAERFGLDPLPGWTDSPDLDPPPEGRDPADALELLSPAPHHFVSSSFANNDALNRREGGPILQINPLDAESRGIGNGDRVTVENRRGGFELCASITDDVRPGVAITYKGYWAKRHGGRNVNWTTPDTLADLAGQSTFHTNRVWVTKLERR